MNRAVGDDELACNSCNAPPNDCEDATKNIVGLFVGHIDIVPK